MKLETLQELYVEQLKDLYSAENQLIAGLEQMIEKATHPELKRAFETHLGETKDQIKHLEMVFKNLGEKPTGETCKAMEGLIKEAKHHLSQKAEPDVRDASMIAMAQRIEHYEIAGYGTVCSYADLLGRSDDKQLLGKILDQEKKTDSLLTDLAENVVNLHAAGQGAGSASQGVTDHAGRRAAYSDTPFATDEVGSTGETQHEGKSAAYKGGERPS